MPSLGLDQKRSRKRKDMSDFVQCDATSEGDTADNGPADVKKPRSISHTSSKGLRNVPVSPEKYTDESSHDQAMTNVLPSTSAESSRPSTLPLVESPRRRHPLESLATSSRSTLRRQLEDHESPKRTRVSPRRPMMESPIRSRILQSLQITPRRSPRSPSMESPSRSRVSQSLQISTQRSPRRPGQQSASSRRSPTEWGRVLASQERRDETPVSRVPVDRARGPTASRSRLDREDVYPMAQEKFQRKIINYIAELRVEVRDLREVIERKVDRGAGEVDMPIQATTTQQLEVLETSLQTPENKKKLTGALSQIGGKNVGENARRILLRLMNYETMTAYSLKGRKGKRPFQKLQLYRAIIDALIKTTGCTEVVAEAAISNTLRYAPDRSGGGGRRT